MGRKFIIYADTDDNICPSPLGTWESVRQGSTGASWATSGDSTSTTASVRVGTLSPNYRAFQYRVAFDTTSIPKRSLSIEFNVTSTTSPSTQEAGSAWEVRKHQWDRSTKDIPGGNHAQVFQGAAAYAALPLVATAESLHGSASGYNKLSGTVTVDANYLGLIFTSNRLLNPTPPAGEDVFHFRTADNTLTQPFITLEDPTEIFNATSYNSGSGTFTVPEGVTEIQVEGWGGGGGGGLDTAQEPGGGGAAYASSTFAVTPGQQINYSVGAAGNPGSAGGDSWAFDASTLLAKGGGGGNGATAGQGGSAAASIGQIKFSGGNGGAQQSGGGSRAGSGGGAAASSEGNGAPGSPGSAGASGPGGVGVAGAGSGGRGSAGGFNDATPGTAPGGGGGGKGTGPSSTSQPGGGGRVTVSWYTLEPAPSGGTSLKAYVAGAFVSKPVKFWNGTSWLVKPVKRWNGSTWV
jgi:hypothetical protein